MSTVKRVSKHGVWKRTPDHLATRKQKAEEIRDLAKKKGISMMKLLELSNMSPSSHHNFMAGLSHDDRYGQVLEKLKSI